MSVSHLGFAPVDDSPGLAPRGGGGTRNATRATERHEQPRYDEPDCQMRWRYTQWILTMETGIRIQIMSREKALSKQGV